MVRLLLAAAVIAAASGASGAATVSRETLERQMLDSCIYRQFQAKDVKRDTMVENCRCASRTAIASFEGDSFDLDRAGGLTGPQNKAVEAGIAACFKR